MLAAIYVVLKANSQNGIKISSLNDAEVFKKHFIELQKVPILSILPK